jgi:dihydrofolate reductase
MSQFKLFIAQSLDGFIARENHSLDWLYAIPNPQQLDHGYNQLLQEIDAIVMGRSTYEEILKFGIEWPYEAYKTYVVTKQYDFSLSTPNTYVLPNLLEETLKDLKKQSQKKVWIVGGGTIISELLNLEAIDEMIISIVPIILGRGILIFPHHPRESKLKLKQTEAFETGIVNLHYVVEKSN